MPTINLRGPEGNAFYLIGAVKTWGRQLDLPTDAVVADMMSGTYEHLLQTMSNWADDNGILLDFTGRDDDEDDEP